MGGDPALAARPVRSLGRPTYVELKLGDMRPVLAVTPREVALFRT